MVVFMFPGQGSQKRGMGAGLFDEVREFTSIEREADALLGFSVRRLCLEDRENRLRLTQYTQPALYVTNALHYYKAIAEGESPDFVVGHSLGEYNALLAAGAFDLLTGLRLVQKRAALMARVTSGGMAAIVGLTVERIEDLIQEHELPGFDIANFNAPLQTVISEPDEAIQQASSVFERAGCQLYMPLPVSAAFHSRYMREAAAAFADFLSTIHFRPLRTAVFSNVTGNEYPAECPTTLRLLLAQQICHPVQWTQTVQSLLARGATSFREVGPGTTLTRLIQQIQ